MLELCKFYIDIYTLHKYNILQFLHKLSYNKDLPNKEFEELNRNINSMTTIFK